MKRAGGRRFYRPQDLAVLRGVRSLLHDEGYTIKGVQRLHREQGVRRLVAATGEADPQILDDLESDGAGLDAAAPDRMKLQSVLKALEAAKTRLDGALTADLKA